MKKLMSIILFTATATFTFGQSKAVEDFSNKFKNDRDAKVVSLNGGIFELVANIAQFADDDEDAEVIGRLASGIKSMNILSIPMYRAGLELSDIDDLKNKLKSEKYEELMTMREGRDRVYFMAKTGGDKINNMLMLINSDDDDFTLINIDGIIEMKDLAYMAKNHDNWH
ncbi:DUF4252 domain-containing protein [Fulvivirga sp.]|jgi:hypothetical protein|uniref:DUF4252 domain-containing protein n=1 Tax=Fulvivirga sp. TaxID=1931237 RepID=UPI0032ED22F0